MGEVFYDDEPNPRVHLLKKCARYTSEDLGQDLQMSTKRCRLLPGGRTGSLSSISCSQIFTEPVAELKSHWSLYLVEIPTFLYLLAYRACLPLKEQLSFFLVAADHLPPEGGNLFSEEDPLSTCNGNTSTVNVTGASAMAYGDYEQLIQSEASQILSYFNLVRNIPALFTALLMCAYSDIGGRKIGLLVACIAGMLKCMYCSLSLYYNCPIHYLMIGEFIEGVGGSIMTATCCANLFLSDILPSNQLMFRFMLIQGLHFLATAIGNVGIGHLIQYLGFPNSFWVVFATYALAALYTSFLLNESLPKSNRKEFHIIQILKDGVGVFSLYCRKNRDNPNACSVLILMLWVIILDNIVILGRNDVDILYMLGSPFCWSSVTIGYFQAVKYLLKGVCGTIGVKVLEIYLSAPVIGVLGGFSGIANSIVMALAMNSLVLWMVVPACLFSGMMAPLAQAIMSEMADADEQVPLFASIGVMEGVCDLLSGTSLNLLYASTVFIFPGMVFALLGLCYSVATTFFAVVACIERR